MAPKTKQPKPPFDPELDRDLNAELDAALAAGVPFDPPEFLAKVKEAARRSCELREAKARGGARPGAGRKPGKRTSTRKTVTFKLRPEIIASLRKMAPSPGKISATLEKMIEKAARTR